MQNQIIIQETLPARRIADGYYKNFLDYCDIKPNTLEGYSKAIRRFHRFLQGNGITAPTREDIRAYRAELIETMRPASVQYYISVLRLFFNWLEYEGLYDNVAIHLKAGVKVDRLHKRTGLNERQIASVLNGVDCGAQSGLRDYALFLTMYYGGFRVIELVRANIEDLETIDGVAYLFFQGKGKDEKAAAKIIPQDALEAIRAYLATRKHTKPGSPLFASVSNHKTESGRLTTRSVSRIVKTLLKAAGFDSSKIVAHSIRKSAITNARLLGADISEAQHFAGHASPNTTMIYDDSQHQKLNRCPGLLSQSLTQYLRI